MSGTIIEQSILKKHFSPLEKLRVVQASHEPGVTVAEIARKYKVGLSPLVKWRKYS